jgi:hypothetical protein
LHLPFQRSARPPDLDLPFDGTRPALNFDLSLD